LIVDYLAIRQCSTCPCSAAEHVDISASYRQFLMRFYAIVMLYCSALFRSVQLTFSQSTV